MCQQSKLFITNEPRKKQKKNLLYHYIRLFFLRDPYNVFCLNSPENWVYMIPILPACFFIAPLRIRECWEEARVPKEVAAEVPGLIKADMKKDLKPWEPTFPLGDGFKWYPCCLNPPVGAL